MKVYQAINQVQSELAKIGITKSRTNTQGASYTFRGIDDIFNTVSPLLAQHGLCILPRVLSREQVERQSKSGGAIFYTTVEVEFDFVSAEDGSKHTVKTFGEAMDSSDKSTNKAMSAAYKYAALQAFAIPTEGDNDADSHTPEVVSEFATKSPVKTVAKKSPLTQKQVEDFLAGIGIAQDEAELKTAYAAAYRMAQGQADKNAIDRFINEYNKRKSALGIDEVQK
jgi:hypothetical protein